MHPSDEHLHGYLARSLPPADLLAVDDHLAECDACRARAAASRGGRPATLSGEVLPVESHLTDEQVGDYVARRSSAGIRAEVDRHLGLCLTCAREVDDLRDWARKRRTSPPLWWAYAAAAAVILAVSAPVVARWRVGDVTRLGASATVAGLEALPPADQQRVRAALQAGFADPPALVADLRGSPEVLMGASRAAPFNLTSPTGTVVASDRPVFRWEPLASAVSYQVLVVDARMQPVLSSPDLSLPTWIPERSLARGGVYAWQVTARTNGKAITAPAPPSPLARFQVLDQQTAELLERLARLHPKPHLVLGLLSTQAGLAEEARRHLAEVPSSDPHVDVARRTLERLD